MEINFSVQLKLIDVVFFHCASDVLTSVCEILHMNSMPKENTEKGIKKIIIKIH